LERSAVKPEVTELIGEAAQGILLRGGSMTQSLRKKPDLKASGEGYQSRLNAILRREMLASLKMTVAKHGESK
jgi:hypothetical protein